MCVQAVKDMTIANMHSVPLRYQPCPFHALLRASLSFTPFDRVLATVVSMSECWQYVSMEYAAEGHTLRHDRSHQELVTTIQKPLGINRYHPQGINN